MKRFFKAIANIFKRERKVKVNTATGEFVVPKGTKAQVRVNASGQKYIHIWRG